MPKGARTIAELERVVLACDLRRRRDMRDVRRELVAIHSRLLISPAANSRPTAELPSGANAGTALGRARIFFSRIFGH